MLFLRLVIVTSILDLIGAVTPKSKMEVFYPESRYPH